MHELEYASHALQRFNFPNISNQYQLLQQIDNQIIHIFNNLKYFFLYIIGLRWFLSDRYDSPDFDAFFSNPDSFSDDYNIRGIKTLDVPEDETNTWYVDFYNRNAERYSKFDYDSKEADTFEMSVPWWGMGKSLKLLGKAKTSAEMASAISLTLNVWHDNGAIFGGGDGDYIWYAPFTQQMDYISNIPTKPIDRSLQNLVI